MTDWKAAISIVCTACATLALWAAGAEARPAVLFSSSEPAMSVEQCLNRARDALDAELFRVRPGDAFSLTGESPTHSVVISCVPLARRVLLEVFTAADGGSDPAALHSRILDGLGGSPATAATTSLGTTTKGAVSPGAIASGVTLRGIATAGTMAPGAAGAGGTAGGSTASAGAAGGAVTAATTGAAAASASGAGTKGGLPAGSGSAATTGTTSAGAVPGDAGSSTASSSPGGSTPAVGSTATVPAGDDAGITLASTWYLVREATIRGQNDASVEKVTARGCLAACEADPQCQSVDYNRVTRHCDLAYRTAKTSSGRFIEHVCIDYYSRDASDHEVLTRDVFHAEVPPEYGTWRRTPDAVLYGKSYVIREVEGSVIDCAQACEADPACKSFNHFPSYPKCTLLKANACEVGTNFWGNGTSAQYHYTREGSRVSVEAPATVPAQVPGPASATRSDWSTDYGDLSFGPLKPGKVTAHDPTGVGEILGDLNGNTLSGHWIRRDGGQRCATEVAGSREWGRLELVFDAAFGGFTGRFGYCDGSMDVTWNGSRQASPAATTTAAPPATAAASSPSTPAAPRDTDIATWTVDYGRFEATPEQIDSAPASDGQTSYYLAPAPFVGDWSGYGALVFEKKSWGGRYFGPHSYGALGDIQLFSGKAMAYFDIPADHSGEWKSYSVPLDGTGWTVTGASDLGAILADVTELRIRAEYGEGQDYSSLRGVRLLR